MDEFLNKMKAAWDYIWPRKVKRVYKNAAVIIISILLITTSAAPLDDKAQLVRKYTRSIEYDYTTWVLNAILRKNQQAAFGLANYIPIEMQHTLVTDCIELTRGIDEFEASLESIYSDPAESNPDLTAQPIKDELADYYYMDDVASPLCETILQQQVSELLAENGLTSIGQPIPPVLYHATPLPVVLIVSPRDMIQQDASISLITDLTLDEIIALENAVESNMNVSALVEPIGGMGAYPTMIQKTSNLPWYIEVIAHEWTHNFLTLRPLGVNYDTTPELRTMNETTANIVGKEISDAVIARYYPEYLPEEPTISVEEDKSITLEAVELAEEPVFDFRAEMRETRVRVDEMLAEGKIKEAEEYMETRRQFIWENGFQIRRLNQAYFAFHGAYADQPGGAAGSDPVGPAVRQLRQQSDSLAAFVRRIGRMNSFEDLQKTLQEN
jgi:hypothetical protein